MTAGTKTTFEHYVYRTVRRKKIMKKNNVGFIKISVVCIIAFLFAAILLSALYGPSAPRAAYAASADDVRREIRYKDDFSGATRASASETVNFATKTDTTTQVNSSFPQYYNTNTALSNTCANVAGAMILGYYDRYFDVIPNFTPGKLRNGNYNYYAMSNNSAPVQNAINALYTAMGTNSPSAGTTQTQYKNGLKSYINGKGRQVTFTSVKTGTTLDPTKVTAAFSAGKPITLFVSGYNFCSIQAGTNSYTINKTTYSGTHIMIAYGIRTIKYYNASGVNFRTDTFLLVSSGLSSPKSGLYFVGTSGTTLNAAESAYVH